MNTIEFATEKDRDGVLALYRAQIGREFCPWDEEYPGNDTIDYDLSRNALIVMRDRKIVGELKGDELSQRNVMYTIAGGNSHAET